MKSPKEIAGFLQEATIHTNDATTERVLRRMHEAYGDSACVPVAGGRMARLAVAAAVLVAAGLLIERLAGPFGGNVAWAQVTERFQSVSFVSGSIYLREYALAQPQQVELWMAKGGYFRVRVGPQVVFGRDGQVTRAFDICRRRPVEAPRVAADLIQMLHTPGAFSLETVIRSISGGKLVDITPALNAEAAIGEDLVVFDAQSAVSPGWVRIYALRETRLPVGIRLWDPAHGFSADALITYAKEQPMTFFDADAFEKEMRDSARTEMELAYLFLKDPGGQDVTSGHGSRQKPTE
jgi:hypothetical protein